MIVMPSSLAAARTPFDSMPPVDEAVPHLVRGEGHAAPGERRVRRAASAAAEKLLTPTARIFLAATSSAMASISASTEEKENGWWT